MPEMEVIGVETELYPSMWAALRGEEAECRGESLAEGIAVKNVGKLTCTVCRALVDDVVLVSESKIEEAVAAYLTLQKTMAEGAGAAGLAALLADPRPIPRAAASASFSPAATSTRAWRHRSWCASLPANIGSSASA